MCARVCRTGGVNIIAPPLRSTRAISSRFKGAASPYPELARNGHAPGMASFLEVAAKRAQGRGVRGTGSGKTTMLTRMSGLIGFGTRGTLETRPN